MSFFRIKLVGPTGGSANLNGWTNHSALHYVLDNNFRVGYHLITCRTRPALCSYPTYAVSNKTRNRLGSPEPVSRLVRLDFYTISVYISIRIWVSCARE